jgi:hypothetical protein
MFLKTTISVEAQKYYFQIKEIKINVILSNLLRAILLFSILIVIEVFYRGQYLYYNYDFKNSIFNSERTFLDH